MEVRVTEGLPVFGVWLPFPGNEGWMVDANGVVIAFGDYRVAQAQLRIYRASGGAQDARVVEIGMDGEPVPESEPGRGTP